MPKERMTFEEVMKQEKLFTGVADRVAEFQLSNFQSLTKKQKEDLTKLEFSLRDIARQLLNDATKIAWDDMAAAVDSIHKATSTMKKTLKRLTSVKRILQFVTAAIAVAGAILSGNPIAIGTTGLELIALSDKYAEEDEQAAEDEDDAVGSLSV